MVDLLLFSNNNAALLPPKPEISFTIAQNFYSTDGERARIHHVTLKDLHVEETFNGASLQGYDEDHRIENVVIRGIHVHRGGETVKFTGDIPYRKREFADEIELED